VIVPLHQSRESKPCVAHIQNTLMNEPSLSMFKKRRKEDPTKEGNDERSDPGYRGQAVMCYAYSAADRHYYVGYSGSSGGMTGWGGNPCEQIKPIADSTALKMPSPRSIGLVIGTVWSARNAIARRLPRFR
jgi:hypothetical protein